MSPLLGFKCVSGLLFFGNTVWKKGLGSAGLLGSVLFGSDQRFCKLTWNLEKPAQSRVKKITLGFMYIGGKRYSARLFES